jgi:dihydrofolate reductase
MGKLVVFNSVTLDGVMQSPGRPDEDTRGGFKYGGWATPFADPDLGKAAGESMATTGGLLFGRRTYLDFHSVWPKRTDGNPFTEALNNTQKYVASRTIKEPLPWVNSALLKGDVPEAVAALKKQIEKDLVILGSGELIRSLARENLIDQYILLIHPLVLGTGQHLFSDDGTSLSLELVDTKTTSKGVVMATYRSTDVNSQGS